MDQTLKVRVEIGPSIPTHLQPIDDPEGFRAMIRALAEVIGGDHIEPGAVVEGTFGSAKVRVSATRLILSRVPVGSPNTSFVKEFEFRVQSDDPAPQE